MLVYIYLIFYLSENFKKGFYEVDYAQRSNELIEWYQSHILKKKYKLSKKSVNLDMIRKRAIKQFNKDSIINGHEGIMIKDPNSF